MTDTTTTPRPNRETFRSFRLPHNPESTIARLRRDDAGCVDVVISQRFTASDGFDRESFVVLVPDDVPALETIVAELTRLSPPADPSRVRPVQRADLIIAPVDASDGVHDDTPVGARGGVVTVGTWAKGSVQYGRIEIHADNGRRLDVLAGEGVLTLLIHSLQRVRAKLTSHRAAREGGSA